MTRLLIREVVHHRLPELNERGRRDCLQIAHLQFGSQRLATTLQFHRYVFADGIVEYRFQWFKLRDVACVHLDQHITRLQLPKGWRARLHLSDHQHASTLRKGFADGRFGIVRQTQSAQFIKRRVAKHGLQRAARDGLAGT